MSDTEDIKSTLKSIREKFNLPSLPKPKYLDKFVGICQGVIADRIINESECIFLHEWLKKNKDAVHQWPTDTLYQRVTKMLEDNMLNNNEQKKFLDILRSIMGTQQNTAPFNQ